MMTFEPGDPEYVHVDRRTRRTPRYSGLLNRVLLFLERTIRAWRLK